MCPQRLPEATATIGRAESAEEGAPATAGAGAPGGATVEGSGDMTE
ncbi:MAG: hypothetical protein IPP10_19025 [Candidatus Competibacteraceae bacterium]|nr:hypothetical protein [Candidatus Competibacteraceae bacterium]MBK8896498.1 hypothetical protein [Candidatus Competibacteraceae bacterium]MBK8964098.1 hypothetical protein [Candidatus Competibacteraceae bacterium]MBK9953493.1 hypothetical protein [Candidatus Competibacteraceae bacterium]